MSWDNFKTSLGQLMMAVKKSAKFLKTSLSRNENDKKKQAALAQKQQRDREEHAKREREKELGKIRLQLRKPSKIFDLDLTNFKNMCLKEEDVGKGSVDEPWALEKFKQITQLLEIPEVQKACFSVFTSDRRLHQTIWMCCVGVYLSSCPRFLYPLTCLPCT